MSHERIARYIGTAREVVSRILRGLACEGLTVAGRGSLRVVDLEALSARLPKD